VDVDGIVDVDDSSKARLPEPRVARLLVHIVSMLTKMRR